MARFVHGPDFTRVRARARDRDASIALKFDVDVEIGRLSRGTRLELPAQQRAARGAVEHLRRLRGQDVDTGDVTAGVDMDARIDEAALEAVGNRLLGKSGGSREIAFNAVLAAGRGAASEGAAAATWIGGAASAAGIGIGAAAGAAGAVATGAVSVGAVVGKLLARSGRAAGIAAGNAGAVAALAVAGAAAADSVWLGGRATVRAVVSRNVLAGAGTAVAGDSATAMVSAFCSRR